MVQIITNYYHTEWNLVGSSVVILNARYEKSEPYRLETARLSRNAFLYA